MQVNKTSGQYARPYEAFSDAEKSDMTTTLTEFKAGYFENLEQQVGGNVMVLSDSSFDVRTLSSPFCVCSLPLRAGKYQKQQNDAGGVLRTLVCRVQEVCT